MTYCFNFLCSGLLWWYPSRGDCISKSSQQFLTLTNAFPGLCIPWIVSADTFFYWESWLIKASSVRLIFFEDSYWTYLRIRITPVLILFLLQIGVTKALILLFIDNENLSLLVLYFASDENYSIGTVLYWSWETLSLLTQYCIIIWFDQLPVL